MKMISTPDAPAPVGHYSQAVAHGGLVYVSGMLPIDPASGEKVFGSPEEQTALALNNVLAAVKAAGGSLDSILKCTIYVSDIDLWPKANAAYTEFFGTHKPARAVVPVPALHFGFLVEIEAVAAVS